MEWPRLRGIAMGVLVAAAVVASWPLNVLDVRARSPFASVASAFGPAPDYPGYRWSRDGREVGTLELATFAGPAHCRWGSATVVMIGWPPGTIAPAAAQARMYARDPQDVLGRHLRARLVLGAVLPAAAEATGYRLGRIELFLSSTDQDDAIYVVAPSGAERWPRVDPMQLCS